VLLIPSIWHETFSLVTREAVLAGLPVVASRMGSIPEIIEDEVNGLLLPPGDLDAWARALRRMVSSPDLIAAFHRAQLGRRSRIKSMDEHVAEMIHLYAQARNETPAKTL
jgi:glycosyltransferase involved in cell wall biosynthesis